MSNKNISRRSFLAVVGAAAVTTAGTSSITSVPPTMPLPEVEWRNKQPEMAYRRLGRTNLMVSEIVFGGLLIRDEKHWWELLETAIDLGINYIDTASNYGNGASELGISRVINTSAKRERVFIASKSSSWIKVIRPAVYSKIWENLNFRAQARVRAKVGEILTKQGIFDEYYLCNYGDWQISEAEDHTHDDVLELWYKDQVPKEECSKMTRRIIEEVEGSLQRLGTDYLDVLMGSHGATRPVQLFTAELLEAVYRLKKDGKIRYFGTSAHSDPAAILRAAAISENYQMVMVAYNISNESWVEPALEEAGRHDLGVIAMKVARAPFPDRNNRVQPLPGLEEKMHKLVPGDKHIAEKAYIWALRNPNITACVSAIRNQEMLHANIRATGKTVKSSK
jgi:aryl-alcohol dehydrogenase-like predicted oxidoreductase